MNPEMAHLMDHPQSVHSWSKAVTHQAAIKDPAAFHVSGPKFVLEHTNTTVSGQLAHSVPE